MASGLEMTSEVQLVAVTELVPRLRGIAVGMATEPLALRSISTESILAEMVVTPEPILIELPAAVCAMLRVFSCDVMVKAPPSVWVMEDSEAVPNEALTAEGTFTAVV